MTHPLPNELLDCAKAIEVGNLNLADSLMKDILTANDTNSATTKLVEYFVEALVRRVYELYPRNPRPLVPSCTDLRCNMDYYFFPFFWFAELSTRNYFLDVLIGKKRVHVIDFSLMPSGRRWCYLMEENIKQLHAPMSFRLTSIGPVLSEKVDYLREILVRLPEEAKKLPIDIEARHLVANCPAEIVESTLKLRRLSEDETIVVRWEFELHKLLGLAGAIEKVMSKLKELRPEIMIVVEQEADLNDQDFLNRFSKSFHHYSIVLDSLDKDNFKDLKDVNHCKVLWEMFFRRQICNTLAQDGIDHTERHETFAQWQDRLRRSGFHHVRLRLNQRGVFWLPEYHIEEKDRHPVLYRHDNLLLVTSSWKPDPAQLNSAESSLADWNQKSIQGAEDANRGGSSSLLTESGTAGSSVVQEDRPDHDPYIMMEGKVWSPECFSINQIAASAVIFDMLEYICHVHCLPLALTWVSDRRECNMNSNEKDILRIENSACFLNDFTMKDFLETCAEHYLEKGKGLAGKALQTNSMYFVSDISKLDANDYPFIFAAWDFGLHAAVAIKLTSIYMINVDYILELFLPPEMKDITAQRLLINEISSILQKNSRNLWRVGTEELSGANISSGIINTIPAATSFSPEPELSEIGSLNSSQIRELGNIFKSMGDLMEASNQGIEEQDSTFRPAAPYPENEVDSIDASHLNKRRRTSEVWLYFDEVRENGELWAKCKGCNTKYRGESTRGTTNLRKHLRSCPGKK